MRENVIAAVKAEVAKVLTHPLAPKMKGFAEHLAYDTDLSAEAAIGCMTAFAKDLAAAPATATAAAGSYLARKAEAGALGLAPLADDVEAAAAGWSKAAAAANARHNLTD